MNKKDRQIVFEKFGGRCAYCGCELTKGWHVDEVIPVKRGWKYRLDINGDRVLNGKNDYLKDFFMECPENLHIDNQNPACASCNINKHSDTLEQFRSNISRYLESLNKRMVQYQMVKKYGLIQETGLEVKFYFETFANPENNNL